MHMCQITPIVWAARFIKFISAVLFNPVPFLQVHALQFNWWIVYKTNVSLVRHCRHFHVLSCRLIYLFRFGFKWKHWKPIIQNILGENENTQGWCTRAGECIIYTCTTILLEYLCLEKKLPEITAIYKYKRDIIQ